MNDKKAPQHETVLGDIADALVLAADTPQFFPPSVSTNALMETPPSFVIAAASPDIVERVEKSHARRLALGKYEERA